MSLRYLIAIEPGTEMDAFGVVAPDLPGCFSAGDTLDEAIANAEEAVAAWIDTALDAGEAVPSPSTLDALRADPEFADWIYGVVAVDPAVLDEVTERVDNSPPRRVLRRLEKVARGSLLD